MTAGTRVGQYEILSLIGAGGMGEVYRARDTNLKRDVALNVLRDAFANDAGRMMRFQREAEVPISGVEELSRLMWTMCQSWRQTQLIARGLGRSVGGLLKVAPRQAKVVELRYFGGLSEEETAEVLQISARTVRRDWGLAKSWLMRELSP